MNEQLEQTNAETNPMILSVSHTGVIILPTQIMHGYSREIPRNVP